MSKKVSIVTISVIIIVISLIISIYIPNKEKIEQTENTSIKYHTIEKEGKIGVSDGVNMIIEPQYDEIIIPNEYREVFLCINQENEKFSNDKNQEIFNEYDNVKLIQIDESKYEKNILIYEENEKYGILEITGKKLTDSKYEEIASLGYKSGEVLIKEDGKYGVITEKCETKIPNKYDSIESDGYYSKEHGYNKSGYIVQKTTGDGYRYGYYDSEGVQVLEEEYNQLDRLTQIKSNDIYLITAKNGQYGVYINNSKIINMQYQAIDYNPELQMFIVERTGKFGAIRLNGMEILKPEYDELQINGIYMYTVNGEEKKVWDTSGNEVDIPFETIIQKTDSEYYIKNENGKYSIVDSQFKTVSEKDYEYLEYLYNNHFIATNEQNKTGIIDLQENIIVEFKYDVIQLIKGNLAVQAIDFVTNNTVFYDKDFKLSAGLIGANIEYLENGFKIYNSEEEFIFDNNGKLLQNKD